MNVKYTNYRTW